MKRPMHGPAEIRFFKPVNEPSDAEKAIRFLAYVALALTSLLFTVWACLTWGPRP